MAQVRWSKIPTDIEIGEIQKDCAKEIFRVTEAAPRRKFSKNILFQWNDRYARWVQKKLLFYGAPMCETSRIGGRARQNNALPKDTLSKFCNDTKMPSAYTYPCTIIRMY